MCSSTPPPPGDTTVYVYRMCLLVPDLQWEWDWTRELSEMTWRLYRDNATFVAETVVDRLLHNSTSKRQVRIRVGSGKTSSKFDVRKNHFIPTDVKCKQIKMETVGKFWCRQVLHWNSWRCENQLEYTVQYWSITGSAPARQSGFPVDDDFSVILIPVCCWSLLIFSVKSRDGRNYSAADVAEAILAHRRPSGLR